MGVEKILQYVAENTDADAMLGAIGYVLQYVAGCIASDTDDGGWESLHQYKLWAGSVLRQYVCRKSNDIIAWANW